MKIDNSPTVTGYEVYHNYVKPHMGLKGKTPPNVAGKEVHGKNKWKIIIENASIPEN
ncbi:MAG: hypothetical protein QXV17_05670 [Candidatus Micrarchaeaceae archaeon]